LLPHAGHLVFLKALHLYWLSEAPTGLSVKHSRISGLPSFLKMGEIFQGSKVARPVARMALTVSASLVSVGVLVLLITSVSPGPVNWA
jgi:hypothetical protein